MSLPPRTEAEDMEGSNSEAIFESLNLNPQLFINEVFNIVEDKLDMAFDFFFKEASTMLNTEGTDRSDELIKGMEHIRGLIQSTLHQRMQMWEEYCLRFIFSVPEGFSLAKTNGLHEDDSPNLDALMDVELDMQLKSIRDRLALVGKESAELDRELRALEIQTLSCNHSAGGTQLFQELTSMASEFRTKLGNLKRKRMETPRDVVERLNLGSDIDDLTVLTRDNGNGLFGAKLEDLQEFLDATKKT